MHGGTTDLGPHFEGLLTRYKSLVEYKLRQYLSKARNKATVGEKLADFVNLMVGVFPGNDPQEQKFVDRFKTLYDWGYDTGEILAALRLEYGTSETGDAPMKITHKNGQEVKREIPDDDWSVSNVVMDDRGFVHYLVRYQCYNELSRRLPEILSNPKASTKAEASVEKRPNNAARWTGKGDNKNAFVQLIYGLWQAGYLNAGRGEITKIVEHMAETLAVPLGKNWQSNHSSSIHKAKRDYHPPIFEHISEAYRSYSSDQIEGKRKNRV